MHLGPRGQGPAERHLDPGVQRGAGGRRLGRADLGGSRTNGTAQRGLQRALRVPVRHLRPDERQGQHITSSVRALPERARGGDGARHRRGEEDLPPASPRSGAL